MKNEFGIFEELSQTLKNAVFWDVAQRASIARYG
jgi:hypothetical protein